MSFLQENEKTAKFHLASPPLSQKTPRQKADDPGDTDYFLCTGFRVRVIFTTSDPGSTLPCNNMPNLHALSGLNDYFSLTKVKSSLSVFEKLKLERQTKFSQHQKLLLGQLLD